jgi:hypothetical protein
MSKPSRQTKPANKVSTKVNTVDAIKTAEDDTVYQNYIELATKLNKEYEKATLVWYWKMGDLFIKFIQSQADHLMGTRTIQHLIADLAAQASPETIAASTLYCAKQIRERYQFDAISTLIDHGVKVGHLKLMMPIKDEAVEAKVTKQMINKDGHAVPVRELKDIIDNAQKDAVVQDTKKAIQQADKTKAEPKGGVTYHNEEDDDTPALKTPGKGEHRSSKAKEFSVSPLKAFRAFDKHGIATIAAIGDTLIAAIEGSKVGFDSDRAQKNFKDAFDGALGTAEQLLEPLEKLIKEMKSVRKDV